MIHGGGGGGEMRQRLDAVGSDDYAGEQSGGTIHGKRRRDPWEVAADGRRHKVRDTGGGLLFLATDEGLFF